MPNPMIRRVNWSITTSTQCVRRAQRSQRNRSMLHRLFECIRAEMKKGSPEGYNAETALREAAQRPQTGEPHECYPLYRIRRSQEKRQLLREGCCREDHRGGQAAGDVPGTAAVGGGSHRAVA